MSALITLPLIRQPWPGQGGLFGGVGLSEDGSHNYALILSEHVPPDRLAWKPCQTYAKKFKGADGHKDYVVPGRNDSRLLVANMRGLIELGWYWTGEQYSEDYAWYQSFNYGVQFNSGKKAKALFRLVRRLRLDSSILLQAAA